MSDTLSAREHDLTVRIAVLEEKIEASEREKVVQAKEYERRLTELNHAHEKQVKDQSTYVSDDRFKGWLGEFNTWRGSLDSWRALVTADMATWQGTRGGANTLRAALFTAGMFILQMVGLIVVAFKK